MVQNSRGSEMDVGEDEVDRTQWYLSVVEAVV
jgi:hypothetical protein